MGDYWTDEHEELFISSKEMLALVHAIRALPDNIRDARVDACVDSKVMIGKARGQDFPPVDASYETAFSGGVFSQHSAFFTICGV